MGRSGDKDFSLGRTPAGRILIEAPNKKKHKDKILVRPGAHGVDLPHFITIPNDLPGSGVHTTVGVLKLPLLLNLTRE
jgi:hypothetical protein